MKLDQMLGFSLAPVRIDPDGSSTPPEVAKLAPPSNPAPSAPSPRQHLFEPTRIEGLAPPPMPGAPPFAPAEPPSALPSEAFAAEPAESSEPSWNPDAFDEALEPEPAASDGSARTPATGSGAVAPPEAPAAESWLSQLEHALGPLLSAHGRAVMLLACASTALLGFGAALIWTRSTAPVQHAPAVAPRAEEPSAKPLSDELEPSSSACARQREPRRVAKAVSASVPLEAQSIPGGVEVLVGGGSPSGEALGLEINATTLEASELVREAGSRELLGVVPVLDDRLNRFKVDRASVGGYRERRTLLGRHELALGRTNRGLHLLTRGDPAAALWPIESDAEISRPRVEWQDTDRMAIALRRGGRHGRIVVGFFDARTRQRSALRELPLEAGELGLPSLALQHNRAAVTAAARGSSEEPWRLELVTSEWYGQTERVALRMFAAAPRVDRIAPSIAVLSDGRWLLQWTEGEQGRRQVRALTLSARLEPLGEPFSISEPGANAGGGLVVPVDEGLLSLYLLQRGAIYELWAAPLACR